jgi:hypothetical protein
VGESAVGVGGRVPDGSALTGTFVDSAQLLGEARADQAAWQSGPQPYQAVMREGFARTDSGAVVATRRPASRPSRDIEFTREGRRVRIAMRAEAGGPTSRVEVYRNDSILVAANLDWQRTGDAWTLTSRTLTVYHGGQPIVRTVRRLGSLTVARADATGHHELALASLGAALFLPAPLQAQFSCLLRDFAVFATTEALIGAALAFYFAPSWATFELFMGAAMAWSAAVDAAIACHEQ